METQAKITQDANNLTKAVQRAFVYATDVSLAPFRDSNGALQYWRVNLIFENSGGTPVQEMRWKVVPLYGPTNSPELQDIRIMQDDMSDGFLGPHMRVPFWDGIVDRSAEERIIRGQELYLVGLIRYTDVFDRHGWHMTKFCFHVYGAPWSDTMTASDMNLLINGADLRFNMCRHNNCADNGCNDPSQ